MMHHEFEKLAGYEVSANDYYKIIEPMYMATEMSKLDFIACLDKKRFALKSRVQLKKEMNKIAEHLCETFTRYTDYESKEKLETLAKQYAKRFYGENYTACVNEEMQCTCYYPVSVSIFSKNSCKVMETITFNTAG